MSKACYIHLQHLTATDRLIDQVVYRLYGLTEDEIALVAGDGQRRG